MPKIPTEISFFSSSGASPSLVVTGILTWASIASHFGSTGSGMRTPFSRFIAVGYGGTLQEERNSNQHPTPLHGSKRAHPSGELIWRCAICKHTIGLPDQCQFIEMSPKDDSLDTILI